MNETSRKADRVKVSARHDRTIAEVAEIAGCCWSTAYKVIRDEKLPYAKERGRVTKGDVKRYADGTRTAKQIAAILRCGPGYVRKTAHRYGFPLRKV